MKCHIMQHFIRVCTVFRQNHTSEKEIQYLLAIITCDPSIYTIDNPDITVPHFMRNSIGTKKGLRMNLRLCDKYPNFMSLPMLWEASHGDNSNEHHNKYIHGVIVKISSFFSQKASCIQ